MKAALRGVICEEFQVYSMYFQPCNRVKVTLEKSLFSMVLVSMLLCKAKLISKIPEVLGIIMRPSFQPLIHSCASD